MCAHCCSTAVKKQKKKGNETGEVQLGCVGSVGHPRRWFMASACRVTGDTDWGERDCLCITECFFIQLMQTFLYTTFQSECFFVVVIFTERYPEMRFCSRSRRGSEESRIQSPTRNTDSIVVKCERTLSGLAVKVFALTMGTFSPHKRLPFVFLSVENIFTFALKMRKVMF